MLYRRENWIDSLGFVRSISLNLPEYETLHQSLVDPECINSILRFIEGPITSMEEINSVDQAIRSLVYHDSPQILAPALNVRYINDPFYNSLTHGGLHINNPDIFRYDIPSLLLKPLDTLLLDCSALKQIMPLEELYQFSSFAIMQSFVHSKESQAPDIGSREDGHHSNFRYICLDPTQYFEERLWLQGFPLDTFTRSIGKYGRPTYVHSQGLRSTLEPPAHIDMTPYFDIIESNWEQHLNRMSKYRINIKLPLCLTIILNRARSREHILEAIVELRDEFSDARRTLWNHLDDAVLRSTSEAEYVRQLANLENSAANVVPAGLRRGELYNPLSVFCLGRLIKWIASGADPIAVIQFVDDTLSGKNASLHSVDMSELLAKSIGDLQPYHHLIEKHLSTSEIDILVSGT